jgi:hypothetical protein
MAHYSEAPEPLDWPDLPDRARDMSGVIGGRRSKGRPYLEWKRPASSRLDLGRRLLATGRYADEEKAAQKAAKKAARTAAGKAVGRPPKAQTGEAKRKRGGDKAKSDAAGQGKRRSSRRSTRTLSSKE